MTPPAHGITARDVPQTRLDLADWLATPATRQLLEERGERGITDFLGVNATSAELYYVNADMTQVAHTAGQDLDVFALTVDDLPSPSGLLVWEQPIDDGAPHWAPVAVMWLAHGTKFVVTLFVSAAGYTAWAKQWGPSGAADSRSVQAGRLVMRGQTQTLPIDGRERPWDRMNLAHNDTAIRTLLATWLLIRQPADERTLHQVENVPAPKAVQRRLRQTRLNADAQVRLVTLRTSLRPDRPAAAGERGHAEKVYRHRWMVRLHRRTYSDKASPSGQIKKWVGPYLAVPKGCEDAPILGTERVNVLRR
ncbi:hypothetical protein [Kitasatospora camelliae]|uniref:Uncharacterized protein n=1 Tax=Kitasatospora camelliae TaxID=3156397 RepID=A0AAU8K6L4_9ACTN